MGGSAFADRLIRELSRRAAVEFTLVADVGSTRIGRHICSRRCGHPAPTCSTVTSVAMSLTYSQTFESLMQDVQNLITLHPAQQGTPGRPAGDTGPLLRSSIVLLNTAWENYVEQLAVEGLTFLLANIGDDHRKLHKSMEQRLAALKNPWALAGYGWKVEARRVVEELAGRLNTPNVGNTEELLDLAVGVPNAIHDISWQKMSGAKVVDNVNEFVQDIRGEIVHKGATVRPLRKSDVTSWVGFFENLVPRLDEAIGRHLESATGARPW